VRERIIKLFTETKQKVEGKISKLQEERSALLAQTLSLSGGHSNKYYHKYLKYKTRYLRLKSE